MKKATIITTTLAMLAFAGCNKPATAKAEPGETKPAAQQTPQASATNDGPFEKWLDEGPLFPKLRLVGKTVNGKLDGELRGFDEEGRLVALEAYNEGVITKRITYYPNKAKFDQTEFNPRGEATGVYVAWFDNGNKRSEINLVDGAAHGKQVEYYLDGSRMTEHMNVNGQAQGEKRHYLRDGTLHGFSTMQNGAVVESRPRTDFPVKVTNADYMAIKERNALSSILKDYWKPDSRALENPLVGMWSDGNEKLDLRGNGIFTYGDKPIGTWLHDGDKLLLKYPNGVAITYSIKKAESSFSIITQSGHTLAKVDRQQ